MCKRFYLTLFSLFSTTISVLSEPMLTFHDGYLYDVVLGKDKPVLTVTDTTKIGVFRELLRLDLPFSPIYSPIPYYDSLYLVSSNKFVLFDINTPEKTELISLHDLSYIAPVTNQPSFKNDILKITGKNGIFEYSLADVFSPVLTDASVIDKSVAPEKRYQIPDFVKEIYASLSCSTNAVNAALYTNITDKSCFKTDGYSVSLCSSDDKIISTFYSTDFFVRGPSALAFDITNNFIIAACKNDGIKVFGIDKTDGSINQITVMKTLGDARDLAVRDGVIYVADGVNGVGFYDIDEYGLISYKGHQTFIAGIAEEIKIGDDNVTVVFEDGREYTVQSKE